MAKRLIGYIRVSTTDQAESGLGLEDQDRKIRALAELEGGELLDVIRDEGASAKSLDRPGVARLLELVRRGDVDAVLIAKLDRLTRSVKDLCDLVDLCRQKDIALVSAAESLNTSTAAGRMVVNMLGVIGQWEREVTAERTSAALQVKAQRGERVSRWARYGWRVGADGVNLEPVEDEQATIATAVELRGSGLSLRQVSAELEGRGMLSRTGKQFTAKAIGSMVERAELDPAA